MSALIPMEVWEYLEEKAKEIGVNVTALLLIIIAEHRKREQSEVRY
jgi:hypothetical protein